jgi:hypothetical protein
LAAHIEIGPAQPRPLIRAGPPGWTGLAHLTALLKSGRAVICLVVTIILFMYDLL